MSVHRFWITLVENLWVLGGNLVPLAMDHVGRLYFRVYGLFRR
jgi:hypothetical protein